MTHHPIALAVVMSAAATLIIASIAAPRVAGIHPGHAALRAGVGIGGLVLIPFFVLTLEAFVR